MNTSSSTHQGPDASKIKQIFSQVASGYDQANQVLSLGIHHLWRQKMVKWAQPKNTDAILDCATGTGDVAIAFKKALHGAGQITGIDFCDDMLQKAPQKALELGYHINFQVADVTQLPFADHSFDIVTISFGIRNVENPLKGIQEMTRVLKPGGQLFILEFGQVKWPLINQLYNAYSRYLLPKIGGLITKHPEAYEYLQTSSAAFPCARDFINLIKQVPELTKFEFKTLQLGIAYLYRAEKKQIPLIKK